MLCAACLSSDWLLTKRLSEIQSGSIRETGMIIAFTSALLQQMFTDIIITNANCPIKVIISRRQFEIFSLFCPEKSVLQFMQTVSFSLGDSLHEMSNPVLSNYVF